MSAGDITVHSPSAYGHLRLDGSAEEKAEETSGGHPHVTLVRSIFFIYLILFIIAILLDHYNYYQCVYIAILLYIYLYIYTKCNILIMVNMLSK